MFTNKSGKEYALKSRTREARIKTFKLVLVLVLVVDERGSFSAIDAHIFPCLIQTVLEDVD